MTSKSSRLLIKVARCAIVSDCLAGRRHDCSSVVAAQGLPPSRHQLPEPWSGRIESAPILFVGSNPSLNRKERFPTSKWSDADIERFFVTRFEDSYPPVQYWRVVRAIASDLLGHTARPGIDFALTEIVRCKSQKEAGLTTAAMAECLSRYFMPTLEIAAAPLVVPLGKKAREGVAAIAGTESTIGLKGPVELSGRERWLLMLGHPSAGQRKKPTDREKRLVRPALS
jgi:uracil-DNA glycosylase